MEMKDGKSVLVIDDDLDFQLMISFILSDRGFRVRCRLKGGADLVHRIVKRCDIVLMNVQLPGINGVDLGRQLKSDPETKQIPIILISGRADGENLLQTSRADAFIAKPFSLSILFAKMNDLLTVQVPVISSSPDGCNPKGASK